MKEAMNFRYLLNDNASVINNWVCVSSFSVSRLERPLLTYTRDVRGEWVKALSAGNNIHNIMTSVLKIQRIHSTRLRPSGSSREANKILLISWAVTFVYFMSCLEAVEALKCVCNPKECDTVRSTECPGKGLIIWDPCKWVADPWSGYFLY